MGPDRLGYSVCDQIYMRVLDQAMAASWYVQFSSLPLLCHKLTDSASAKTFFFISVMRNAFVIIFLTLASWLYCRDTRNASGDFPIRILKTVPSGLKQIERPTMDQSLLSALAPKLPVATIILLLEHIAISKCEDLDIPAASR
jgi:solute carrier family 26 (sodium-independent sulfate anion transporter), member 11